MRTIECYDIHGVLNTQCDPKTRPATVQQCSTGISCTTDIPSLEPSSNINENLFEKSKTNNNSTGNEDKLEDLEEEPEDNEDSEEDDDKYLGDEPQVRPLVYQYQVPRAERLVDPNVPNEAT